MSMDNIVREIESELIANLIEFSDDIEGVRIPEKASQSLNFDVWIHTTQQVNEWLQRFAEDRGLVLP